MRQEVEAARLEADSLGSGGGGEGRLAMPVWAP